MVRSLWFKSFGDRRPAEVPEQYAGKEWQIFQGHLRRKEKRRGVRALPEPSTGENANTAPHHTRLLPSEKA